LRNFNRCTRLQMLPPILIIAARLSMLLLLLLQRLLLMCDEFIYYAIIIMKWCLPVANSYDDNGANILYMYISYIILIIEGGHSPSYKRARDEFIIN
jgi:hypothetical protein